MPHGNLHFIALSEHGLYQDLLGVTALFVRGVSRRKHLSIDIIHFISFFVQGITSANHISLQTIDHIGCPSLAAFQSASNPSQPLGGASHMANSPTLIS